MYNIIINLIYWYLKMANVNDSFTNLINILLPTCTCSGNIKHDIHQIITQISKSALEALSNSYNKYQFNRDLSADAQSIFNAMSSDLQKKIMFGGVTAPYYPRDFKENLVTSLANINNEDDQTDVIKYFHLLSQRHQPLLSSEIKDITIAVLQERPEHRDTFFKDLCSVFRGGRPVVDKKESAMALSAIPREKRLELMNFINCLASWYLQSSIEKLAALDANNRKDVIAYAHPLIQDLRLQEAEPLTIVQIEEDIIKTLVEANRWERLQSVSTLRRRYHMPYSAA